MPRTLSGAALGLSLALAATAPAAADTITIFSDASTLAAASSDAQALSGDPTGLVFEPVINDALGTFTPLPTGSPAGTSVVNIPPGGASGFFKIVFSLPTGFSNASISGGANVDDVGSIYLNGTSIGSASEFGDETFFSDLGALFLAGDNVFLVSDINSGGGPSGGAFYANITYDLNSSAPEPATWAVMLMGLGLTGGVLRRRASRPATTTS